MKPGAFEIELSAVFSDGHHNLTVQSFVPKEDASELLLAGGSVAAMQDFYSALRDTDVCRCLESWPNGELLVSVLGSGWSAPVPAARINCGAIFLVSGSPGTVEHSEDPMSFAEWFERLIGVRPPFAFDLERRGTDLWGSPETRARKVSGLWGMMRIADSTSYNLVGFDGYGANSYALYVTRVSGPTRMYLRMPWGGAYMDPEVGRAKLLGELGEANALFELAVAKRLPMRLNNNMGDWYVADVAEPSHDQKVWGAFLDKARRYVETGVLDAPDLMVE